MSIEYHASGMVLHVHSDGSYLSAPRARSRASGVHFLSDAPPPGTNFEHYAPPPSMVLSSSCAKLLKLSPLPQLKRSSELCSLTLRKQFPSEPPSKKCDGPNHLLPCKLTTLRQTEFQTAESDRRRRKRWICVSTGRAIALTSDNSTSTIVRESST